MGRIFPAGKRQSMRLLAGSIAGILPLAGFWSKWMIINAAAEKELWIAARPLGAGTVLSCLYYVLLLRTVSTDLLRSMGTFQGRESPFHQVSFDHPGASAVLFALLYLTPLALRDQFPSRAAMDPEMYIQSACTSLVHDRVIPAWEAFFSTRENEWLNENDGKCLHAAGPAAGVQAGRP